jgi:rubrerythrin
VFVAKDGGHVEPRQVQLGLEADDYLYEIRTGVREGERVVTSAAFLLDSETQLQEALKRLSGDSSSFVTAFTPQAGKEPVRLSEGEPTLRTEAAPEDKPRGKVAVGPTMDELFLQAQLFICPTHDAIVDDEKNTVCPLCKSALVALDSAEVTALRMAEPFGCVMCPVIVPGTQRETRCPICNMKLTAIENPTRK